MYVLHTYVICMYWNLIVVMIAQVFGYVKNQRLILSKECAIWYENYISINKKTYLVWYTQTIQEKNIRYMLLNLGHIK